MIDEAGRVNCLRFAGVLGGHALDWLRGLSRGVGVRSWTSSFEMTLSGSNGTKLSAVNAIWIVAGLKASA